MHRNIRRPFNAIRVVNGGRAVLINRALIDLAVMSLSRNDQYEIVGEPLRVSRGRENEWIVTETRMVPDSSI